MKMEKRSITLPAELAKSVQTIADARRLAFSAALTETVARGLNSVGGATAALESQISDLRSQIDTLYTSIGAMKEALVDQAVLQQGYLSKLMELVLDQQQNDKPAQERKERSTNRDQIRAMLAE